MPGSVVHLAMLERKAPWQAGPSPPKIVKAINFLWLLSSIGVYSGLSIFKVNSNKKKKQMVKLEISLTLTKFRSFDQIS